ncbi:unnamed protein product [Leuciscus chuanchicus]
MLICSNSAIVQAISMEGSRNTTNRLPDKNLQAFPKPPELLKNRTPATIVHTTSEELSMDQNDQLAWSQQLPDSPSEDDEIEIPATSPPHGHLPSSLSSKATSPPHGHPPSPLSSKATSPPPDHPPSPLSSKAISPPHGHPSSPLSSSDEISVQASGTVIETLCVNLNDTHTPGNSMNEHGTSLQQQNGHAVDISHKDNDNTTEPQQPLLTDTISAEPCPQSSPQTDILELLQDSAPKDDFLENSQGSQDSISQPPITPEQQPLSPDTLSLSPATPLLCFSQKMEELVHAGTRLSHSFAASPQIPTKKRQAPQTPRPARRARPPAPSSCESSSASSAKTPGPTPSSICSR